MRCQFDDDVFDQSVGVMSFFEFFFVGKRMWTTEHA